MEMQNINVWSMPILCAFWNELMWKYEKCESDELVTVLNLIEEEVKKREWKYFKKEKFINISQ